MGLLNRAKILWSYAMRRDSVRALPVEYIVETTAKCNLYCPMCPRKPSAARAGFASRRR